jgi:preprotein translocase subunit YajC
MLVAMIAIFYFLLIRPENKKKKAISEMRASLKVGDEITTIGGVVGTICAVKEETVVIETGADRVRLEFTKWAISSKGTQTDQDAAPAAEKKGKKEKKEESAK